MVDALSETAVGRALLALWENMPLWVMADVLLAASLLPSLAAWFWGNVPLAIALSFPATFVVAGMAGALAQSVRERTPRWRDLLRINYTVVISVWVALVTIVGSFLIAVSVPVFAVQCVAAAVVLMIAPFVLCASALWPVNLRLAWRNALVLAVRRPIVAVGLLALAAILGWLVLLSNGGLFLVVPAIWVSIAVHSVDEIVRTHCALETKS